MDYLQELKIQLAFRPLNEDMLSKIGYFSGNGLSSFTPGFSFT